MTLFPSDALPALEHRGERGPTRLHPPAQPPSNESGLESERGGATARFQGSKASLTGARALLGILGLAAAGVIAYATRWGPWVFSDSVEYLLSAENLGSGYGLGIWAPSGEFMPLLLHPPLYPLVLAALRPLFGTVLDTAHAVSIVQFGLIVSAAGLLLFHATQRFAISLSLGMLLLTSPVLIHLCSGAMSEPLFLLAGVSGLLFASIYVLEGKKRLLWLAALAFGMSSLARYPGVVYTLAAAVGIVALGRSSFLKRLQDAILLSMVGFLPLFLWLAFSYAGTRSLGARSFQFDLAGAWDLHEPVRAALVDIPWGWTPLKQVFPELGYRGRVLVMGLAIVVVLALYCWGYLSARRRAVRDDRFSRNLVPAVFFAVFATGYVAFLSVAYVFGSPQPDLDDRMLSPLLSAMLVVLLCSVAMLSLVVAGRWWAGLMSAAVVSGFLVAHLPAAIRAVDDLHREGLGYTSLTWRSSATVQAVRDLPAEMALISDESEALMFLAGRPAFEISELAASRPLGEYTTFGDDLTDPIQRLFGEGKAALVLFRSAYWQFHSIYGDRTEERLEAFTRGLRVHRALPDGVIYLADRDG